MVKGSGRNGSGAVRHFPRAFATWFRLSEDFFSIAPLSYRGGPLARRGVRKLVTVARHLPPTQGDDPSAVPADAGFNRRDVSSGWRGGLLALGNRGTLAQAGAPLAWMRSNDAAACSGNAHLWRRVALRGGCSRTDIAAMDVAAA